MHMHQRLATDRLVDFSTVEPKPKPNPDWLDYYTFVRLNVRTVYAMHYACLHVCLLAYLLVCLHLLQITSHQIRVD